MDEENKLFFNENGYVILQNHLALDTCSGLKQAVDQVIAGGTPEPLDHPEIFALLQAKEIHDICGSLLGERYVFHHLNAARHESGTPSLGWHHDYERYRHKDRNFKMIHIFIYLNGLNRTIGELLVLSGSQRKIVDRYALSSVSLDEFPEKICINKLEVGSILVINSATIHARRALPGGEERPRYFIDISFCEAGGKWSPFMERGNWKTYLERLDHKALEVGRPDLRYLFDKRQFHIRARDQLIDFFKLRRAVNFIRGCMKSSSIKKQYL